MTRTVKICLPIAFLLCLGVSTLFAEDAAVKVEIHWDKILRVSKTSPSLLFVATPKTRRGAPLHDSIFRALGELKGDDVRYAPSKLYPHFAVADSGRPPRRKPSGIFPRLIPSPKR